MQWTGLMPQGRPESGRLPTGTRVVHGALGGALTPPFLLSPGPSHGGEPGLGGYGVSPLAGCPGLGDVGRRQDTPGSGQRMMMTAKLHAESVGIFCARSPAPPAGHAEHQAPGAHTCCKRVPQARTRVLHGHLVLGCPGTHVPSKLPAQPLPQQTDRPCPCSRDQRNEAHRERSPTPSCQQATLHVVLHRPQ